MRSINVAWLPRAALLFCLAGICRAMPALADDASPIREGPALIDPASVHVGELAPDVAFTDLDGKPGRLGDYRGRPVVIIWRSESCPISKKYGPVLAELARQSAGQGVTFLAVNAAARQSAQRGGPGAPVLGPAVRSIPSSAANFGLALRPRTTTEALVLDAARTIVYRGAVDDQFGIGYSISAPRHRYLADAISAVISGQTPAVQATTAPGCAVDFSDQSAPVAAAPLTFHGRIERIVQQRCATCHRPGEAAPFNLLTLEDVKENRAMIRRVVSRGAMPPWFAEGEFGHWANDRRLRPEEKADMLSWLDSDMPEGDKADAPLSPAWVDGWRIGRPDQVFAPSRGFAVPATGVVEYQHLVVPTGLEEDKWVRAVEIRTSHPEVVHHVLVFVKYPVGHPLYKQQPRYKGGLGGYFAGLVPGSGHSVFPDGSAKLLPAGSVLIFQIHYTPNGKAVEDKPQLGVFYTDGPPKHELMTIAAFDRHFQIPPGDDNFPVMATYTFKGDTRLFSFNPHAHVRGKAFRYELEFPDGRTQRMLEVPRYDFNWQIEYQLRDPIDVPAGAKLRVTAWYDNSEKNPANPDPTKTVTFGDQTWEEMMIGYFSGYRLAPPAAQAAIADPPEIDEAAE